MQTINRVRDETDRVRDHLDESIRQILPLLLQFRQRFTYTVFITGDWIINDLSCSCLNSLKICLARLFLAVKTLTHNKLEATVDIMLKTHNGYTILEPNLKKMIQYRITWKTDVGDLLWNLESNLNIPTLSPFLDLVFADLEVISPKCEIQCPGQTSIPVQNFS